MALLEINYYSEAMKCVVPVNIILLEIKEVPAVCRSYFKGMSENREDNLVAGLSIGGYGAVKAAQILQRKAFIKF